MHVATTKCVPYLEDGKVNSQSEPVSPSLREAETHHRRQKRHPLPDSSPPAPGAVSLLFLPPQSYDPPTEATRHRRRNTAEWVVQPPPPGDLNHSLCEGTLNESRNLFRSGGGLPNLPLIENNDSSFRRPPRPRRP